MTTSASQTRFDSLQLLRGIAATLVAAFHLNEVALNHGNESHFFSAFAFGNAGVDLFFVLSGFIIYFVYDRSRPSAPQFLVLRFWRIFPPYWALLVLYILLQIAREALGRDAASLNPLRLLVSFFLLPYPGFIMAVAWTLSIELIFYLVFSVSRILGSRRIYFATMLLWALAAQLSVAIMQQRPTIFLYVFHPAVIEFLFGSMIAYAWLAGWRKGQLPALITGVIWMTAHVTGLLASISALPTEFSAGIPAALIIYGSLGLKIRLPRPVLFWGESSYLLYLSHFLIFSLLGEATRRLFHIDVYLSDIAMLIMLITTIALSWAAHTWLERPYQRWYHARRRRRLTPSAA